MGGRGATIRDRKLSPFDLRKAYSQDIVQAQYAPGPAIIVSGGSAIGDAEKRQHPCPYPHIEIGGRGARLLEGHSEVAAEKAKSSRHHM